MLRSFIALIVNLVLIGLLMAQTTPEGEMLCLEYKGLLIAMAILFICAIINVLFLIVDVDNDAD